MAMNDTAILIGIVTFFLLLGFAIPYINADFNADLHENDINQINEAAKQSYSVDALDVLFSVMTIFFWTFGALPLFFDLVILTPMRIAIVALVVRIVRGVG